MAWDYSKGPKRVVPQWLSDRQMEYARVPSATETEMMVKVRAISDEIARGYQERLKREIEGKPDDEHPAICSRIQREFLEATEPLMRAASDVMAVMPLTYIVTTAQEA